MVQKLEEIKGGGGSIRVGTTGTISALMTRELESIKTQAEAASSGDKHNNNNNNNNKHTTALAVPKMQTRKSLDEEASSSSSSSKCSKGGSHRIPMLRSENVTLDRTPSRDKTTNKKKKKGTNIVEVVDIKCGHPDKASITSKLKKLGFSKLSDTIL